MGMGTTTSGRNHSLGSATMNDMIDLEEVDREWIKLHRDTCPHDGAVVNYDDVLARFPRFYGRCPDCGASLIKYASWAHYGAGDW
jgi:hypothetical protein